MRLAFRLGIPPEECKRRVGSAEFVRCQLWMEEERKQRDKIEYYLAQIAAILVQVNSKKGKGKKLEIENFLLKFEYRNPKTQEEELTPEERTRRSMVTWFGALGLELPEEFRKPPEE